MEWNGMEWNGIEIDGSEEERKEGKGGRKEINFWIFNGFNGCVMIDDGRWKMEDG